MKKIDLRYASALVVLVAAFVALIVVNQTSDQSRETESVRKSENVFGISTMPSVAGGSQSTSSWFCPGVPGLEKTVSSEIVIANSTDIPITGKVTFLSSDKPAAIAQLIVQPFTRSVIDATGGRKSKFISAVVELDNGAVAVEQRIIHPAGDSVSLCANKPSDRWFFADGFTGSDSLFNVLLSNPFPDATVVDVSFVTADGKREPASLKGIIIEPESVYSLSMSDQGARNEAVLAVSIRATSGRFVAGKLQHFLGRGRLGYSTSLGASSTSRQWWFAGGQKDLDVDEQLVVFNPTEQDQSVSVAFLTGVAEEIFREPLVLTIPAGRVTTLETSKLPAITDGRYGVVVSSITNDFVTSNEDSAVEFVVVEQVISRREDKKTGTTTTFGARVGAPSRIWTVASGVPAAGGTLVVLNATSLATTLKVSTIGPAGSVAIEGFEKIELGAAAVLEIKIPTASADLPILIEADNEVVVQREVNRGHELIGFSSVLALPHRSSGIAAVAGK